MKKRLKSIISSIGIMVLCLSLMCNWFLLSDNHRLNKQVSNLSQWEEKYNLTSSELGMCSVKLNATEEVLETTQNELEQVQTKYKQTTEELNKLKKN